MKDRPILFQGAMVRALQAGRKTQTRRMMKPQPHPDFLARGVHSVVPQWPQQDGVRWFMRDGMSELVPCPYGAPGDRLWVRETFYESGYYSQSHPEDDEWRVFNGARNKDDYFYKADGIPPRRGKTNWSDTETNEENAARLIPQGISPFFTDKDNRAWRQRPSIHMPRKVSRITLQLASVRVERLLQISEEDAIAEGAKRNDAPGEEWDGTYLTQRYIDGIEGSQDDEPHGCARDWYREVWEGINGKGSWALNPWVWVLEFERVEAEVSKP